MKKYIIFGAGVRGRYALHLLGKDNVAYFCANQQDESYLDGIEIINFKQLKEIHARYCIVIAVAQIRDNISIAMQLERNNIPYTLLADEATKQIRREAMRYQTLNTRPSLQYNPEHEYIHYLDRFDMAGCVDSYFWQDLWAAQHIYDNRPAIHSDIGSRIDGFIAHLLSFHQSVQLFDIRPLHEPLPNVRFIQCDATLMDEVADNSIESLSALCSLEHFGLGRYGDEIDPEACFKCFVSISRKLKSNADFYLSLPIGCEHLEYNAHRVFFASTIKDSFPTMDLIEFSSCYRGTIEYKIDLHKYDNWAMNGGERFGLFYFKKR